MITTSRGLRVLHLDKARERVLTEESPRYKQIYKTKTGAAYILVQGRRERIRDFIIY